MAILACWVFFTPLHVGASPLDLTTTSPGDVSTFSIDVNYDHTTGVLTANGSSDGNSYSVLDDNGYFYPATFAITATLNPANGALESGTVSISGTEYYTVDNSPLINDGNDAVLLTGNLTAFGFPNPTDSTNVPLEFEFNITGGALTQLGQPEYNATVGGSIVHTLTSTPYFESGWPSSSFSSVSDASYSDTFPISFAQTPEPSTFVLFALGLLPVAWRLRRRGHQPA